MKLKQRIIELSQKFAGFAQTYKSLTPVPTDQKVAAGQLRELAKTRADLILADVHELAQMSALSQERISLLMRFRPQITGEDGQRAADLITKDMRVSAQSVEIASNFLISAQSFNPGISIAVPEQALKKLSDENARLIQAIIKSTEEPMTAEQLATFFNGYPAPKNPGTAFHDVTQKLAANSQRQAELSLHIVEQTMDYVTCLNTVIIPSFPEHAENFKAQATNMMQDAVGSLKRAQALDTFAQTYEHEMR